jgi:hypothetical protein
VHKRYTPPYFTILSVVSLLNIVFATYFIPLILAGIVFKILYDSINNSYNYMVIYSVFTFAVIENTQGLRIFSLTLISLVIYFFIIPRIKHILSSSLFSQVVYISIFYFSFYLMVLFTSSFQGNFIVSLLLNFFIDSFIVGFIL